MRLVLLCKSSKWDPSSRVMNDVTVRAHCNVLRFFFFYSNKFSFSWKMVLTFFSLSFSHLFFSIFSVFTMFLVAVLLKITLHHTVEKKHIHAYHLWWKMNWNKTQIYIWKNLGCNETNLTKKTNQIKCDIKKNIRNDNGRTITFNNLYSFGQL